MIRRIQDHHSATAVTIELIMYRSRHPHHPSGRHIKCRLIVFEGIADIFGAQSIILR